VCVRYEIFHCCAVSCFASSGLRHCVVWRVLHFTVCTTHINCRNWLKCSYIGRSVDHSVCSTFCLQMCFVCSISECVSMAMSFSFQLFCHVGSYRWFRVIPLVVALLRMLLHLLQNMFIIQMFLIQFLSLDRAIVRAVSRQLVTAKARVRFQGG